MTKPILGGEWRALSLLQPWASLVASGRKRIENRPRPTRLLGFVLIHASQAPKDPMGCVEMCQRLGVEPPDPATVRRGGIVGLVEITGCVTSSADPWFFDRPGNHGYTLANACPLPFVPCKGALGFWRVRPETLAELRRMAPEAGL